MEKRNKIIYWIATGLLCAFMAMAAIMYFANFEEVSKKFISLGYPTRIIYPLGIAKLLAVIAILSRKSNFLKEWAYSGLSFVFIIAFLAHVNVNDGEFAAPLVAIILLIVSYVFDKKVFPGQKDA